MIRMMGAQIVRYRHEWSWDTKRWRTGGQRGRKKDLLDHIVVLEFLEQTDFAYGGTRHAFVFRFQPDFLQCYDLPIIRIPSLVYNTICPFGKTTKDESLSRESDTSNPYSPSPK